MPNAQFCSRFGGSSHDRQLRQFFDLFIMKYLMSLVNKSKTLIGQADVIEGLIVAPDLNAILIFGLSSGVCLYFSS